MGSMSAAFRAGTYPKKMPMKAQMQKLRPTLQKGTLLGIISTLLANQLPPYPRATPRKAPVSDIMTLSMRN